MLLSDVCLPCTSGLNREKRPRKTKIGTEVAHVTRDSDTTFKFKRSKVKVTGPLYSPWPQRVRQLQRGNVLGMGNYCYVAVCSAVLGAHRGRRGVEAYRGGRPPTACLEHLLSLSVMCACLFSARASLEALVAIAMQAYAELNRWREVIPLVAQTYNGLEDSPPLIARLW